MSERGRRARRAAAARRAVREVAETLLEEARRARARRLVELARRGGIELAPRVRWSDVAGGGTIALPDGTQVPARLVDE